MKKVIESSGEWKLANAYTYVKVDADIEMKMFFMNTDLFKAMLNLAYLENGETAPDPSQEKTTFHYHSVKGY